MKKHFLLVVLFALLKVTASAQKIINLSDYGVIPNSYQNASAHIARAIKDAVGFDSCILKFPGGRIDLWPDGASKQAYYISNATENDSLPKEKIIGMLFQGLSNITLEGNNTLLVYHGKMMLMAIDNCHNFKVEDLRFDFQRPTMSEMKIISKTDSDVVVNINPDSWYAIEEQNKHNKLIWYGEGWKTNNPFLIRYVPSQETLYYDSWKPFSNSNAIELSPSKVKFHGDFKDSKFESGDILTVRDPYRDEVGVFNNCSVNVTFKNLKFYYIHGLGIVSQLSKNISINNVSIAPKPGSGRVIATFADCFHFSGCYGLVKIENSHCSGSHDDPVNIHGTALRIIKADSNKLIVRFMHDQTWGFNAFEKSDSVEFVNHKTLLPFGTAVVKSSKLISKKEIELELNVAAPKQWEEGDCIENISKTPFVIINNNRFEHTETRGVLVTTRRNVLIEGNTFYRTGMHAILIADDCNSWFESGSVKDVTIRNNKFMNCAYNSASDDYVIAIKPETNHFEKGRYVHSNINITGNEFQVFDTPLLFARNVDGLNFNGNKIIQKSLPGFPSGKESAFSIEHCNEIQILNNIFVGGALPKEIQMRNMERNAVRYKPLKEFNLIIK
jgi:hypothetical protein